MPRLPRDPRPLPRVLTRRVLSGRVLSRRAAVRRRRHGPSAGRLPDRAGFIILFGSRNIFGTDPTPPVEGQCPRCGQQTTLIGRSYRHWFTLFFLPIFPMSGQHRFSECTRCHAQFPLPLEELRGRLNQADQHTSQQAIGLYNSLRASPGNSITLNELMLMYASMKEFDQAASAAKDFPEALQHSEQCMSTLGRVYLAMNRHADAIQWFDQALARNPALGEAQYHKAVAYLSAVPPDFGRAAQAARAARNAGYPRADELLREAEAKARGE